MVDELGHGRVKREMGETCETRGWFIWSIWFVWSVLFIWLVSFNQTNQRDRIDQRDQNCGVIA